MACDEVKSFLELILWTGRIAHEHPVSAILVAPPGAGKTSILSELQCDYTVYMSDMTAKTLHVAMKNSPKATHILLGDMLALFGHKGSVVNLSCRILSALAGETLCTDPFDGQPISRQLGLITAIPPEDIVKTRVRNQLESGGFASRFLIIRYDYSMKARRRIHRSIRAGEYERWKPQPPQLSDEIIEVEVNPPENREIETAAMSMKRDPLGTRIHHHLRALSKAEARRCGRREVIAKDLEVVLSYADFLSDEGRIL